MSTVDDLYINRLSIRLEKFKRVKNSLYNFRCPFCGDSKKNKNKARGYFFLVKGRMVYKCHNCGVGKTTANFLKDFAPDLYSEYQLEKYRMNSTGKGTTVTELVSTFEKTNNIAVPMNFVERRPGDVSKSFADPTIARELISFECQKTIEDMCLDTWNWVRKNPSGYSS